MTPTDPKDTYTVEVPQDIMNQIVEELKQNRIALNQNTEQYKNTSDVFKRFDPKANPIIKGQRDLSDSMRKSIKDSTTGEQTLSMKGFEQEFKSNNRTAQQVLGVSTLAAAKIFGFKIETLINGLLVSGTIIKKFLINKFLSALKFVFKGFLKGLKFTIQAFIAPFMWGVKLINKSIAWGNKSREEIAKIEQAMSDTRDKFATLSSGRGMGANMFINLRRQFFAPGNRFVRTFGKDVEGLNNAITKNAEILDQMGSYSEYYDEYIFGDMKRMELLTKLTGSLGLEAEGVAYHTQEAVTNNENVLSHMYNILHIRRKVSKETGVDGKRLSKFYNSLRKDIVNFDAVSDKALMSASAKMIQFGLDVQNVAEVMGKFNTFEDAAKSAAMLSQAFGMNIDAMKLIQTDNPLEVFEMMRVSLQETGRTFESLNRHEKRLMTNYTGLSAKNLKALMKYREEGMSLEEAQAKLAKDDPAQKQYKAITNLVKAVNSFKESINVLVFDSGFDMLTKTMERIMTAQGGRGNVFTQLSKSMETFASKATASFNAGPLHSFIKDHLSPVIQAYKNDAKGLGDISDDIMKHMEVYRISKNVFLKDHLENYLKSQNIEENQIKDIIKRASDDDRELSRWYVEFTEAAVIRLTEKIKNTQFGGALKAHAQLGSEIMGYAIKMANSISGPLKMITENTMNSISDWIDNPNKQLKGAAKGVIDFISTHAGVTEHEVRGLFETLTHLTTLLSTQLGNILYKTLKVAFGKIQSEYLNKASFYNLHIAPIFEPLLENIKSEIILALRTIADAISDMLPESFPALDLFSFGLFDSAENKLRKESTKILRASRFRVEDNELIQTQLWDRSLDEKQHQKILQITRDRAEKLSDEFRNHANFYRQQKNYYEALAKKNEKAGELQKKRNNERTAKRFAVQMNNAIIQKNMNNKIKLTIEGLVDAGKTYSTVATEIALIVKNTNNLISASTQNIKKEVAAKEIVHGQTASAAQKLGQLTESLGRNKKWVHAKIENVEGEPGRPTREFGQSILNMKPWLDQHGAGILLGDSFLDTISYLARQADDNILTWDRNLFRENIKSILAPGHMVDIMGRDAGMLADPLQPGSPIKLHNEQLQISKVLLEQFSALEVDAIQDPAKFKNEMSMWVKKHLSEAQEHLVKAGINKKIYEEKGGGIYQIRFPSNAFQNQDWIEIDTNEKDPAKLKAQWIKVFNAIHPEVLKAYNDNYNKDWRTNWESDDIGSNLSNVMVALLHEVMSKHEQIKQSSAGAVSTENIRYAFGNFFSDPNLSMTQYKVRTAAAKELKSKMMENPEKWAGRTESQIVHSLENAILEAENDLESRQGALKKFYPGLENAIKLVDESNRDNFRGDLMTAIEQFSIMSINPNKRMQAKQEILKVLVHWLGGDDDDTIEFSKYIRAQVNDKVVAKPTKHTIGLRSKSLGKNYGYTDEEIKSNNKIDDKPIKIEVWVRDPLTGEDRREEIFNYIVGVRNNKIRIVQGAEFRDGQPRSIRTAPSGPVFKNK